MSKKTAVVYAEEDLGVHSVYEDAFDAQMQYEKSCGELVGMRKTKRHLQETITDRESVIAAETTLASAGHSQAAIDRQTKLSIGVDDFLKTLRQQLRECQDDIDAEETQSALAKARMEICSARMTELGGYLHYLAAAKSAASTTSSRTDPW